MNHFCENLINESNRFHNLAKKEIYQEIFLFLQKYFGVRYIKIDIRKEDTLYTVFDNIVEHKNHIYTQNIHISNCFEIIWQLIFINDKIEENRGKIDLSLKTFSNNICIKHLKATIKDAAVTDQLTECYNRVYLLHSIKTIFELANRENKKIAFLKIEVDRFKAVLDEFDYNIGDEVIIRLAKVLKEELRGSDIIVRMSNDSFLVILQNIVNENNALLVANKLIETFKKEKVVVNKKTGQVLMKTICVGIVIYPDDGYDLDTIIRKVDIAMLEAKNRGRSKAFIFSEDETAQIELF